MRRVVLDARIENTPAREVFERVLEFGRYPELCPHVQCTTVHQGRPADNGSSSWVLHFRSGLLSWTENERFQPEQLLAEFDQDYGDFDQFTGHWQLRQAGEHTDLHFEVDFDFGIPSLEGILDPIAERVIRETVAWAVVGMFQTVQLSDDAPTVPLDATTVTRS